MRSRGNAVAAPLVRVRGVGETVAHDPVAARQRRADHLVDVLAPRGEHQQRLGVMRHGHAQQQFAQLLAEGRATRFARGRYAMAARADCLCEPRRVRALAGAVDTFERDESALLVHSGTFALRYSLRGRQAPTLARPIHHRPPFWNFVTARLCSTSVAENFDVPSPRETK